MAITVEARTQIISLVVGMFDAAPGASVLSDLTASYEAGSSVAQIAASLANTNEFKGLFPNFMTNGEFATKVVNNLLGEATAEAKAEAVTVLTAELNGGMTRVNALLAAVDFVNNSAPNVAAYTSSATAFDNKVSVATYYSVDKQLSGSSLSDLQGVIETVTSSAASVTAAKAVADGTASVGKTFTLTTGTDSISGTANNDVINAVLQGASAAGTTIAPGDAIDGKEGVDTLVLSIAGALGGADHTLSAVNADVEKFLISNFETTADKHVIDTTLMDKLTTVGQTSSSATGDIEFNGFNSIVNAEMRNGTGDLTLTFNGAGSVAGTSDALTLTLSNQTGGTFTANKIETINIVSEITKNSGLAIVSDALKKVVVTGSENLTIATALNFAANGTSTAPGAVVDASAFTGALTLTTTASEVFDIKGGSGNDTFNLASLTKNDKLDAGAGNDTALIVAHDAAVDGAIALGTMQFTGLETFSVEATDNKDTSVDADGATVSTLALVENNTTSKDATVTNIAAGMTIAINNNVDGQDAGAFTLSLKDPSGSADSISLQVNGTSGQGVEAIETITLSNVETVNLASGSYGATAMLSTDQNVLTNMNVGSTAHTLNLSGAANLTFSNAITGTKLKTINASAMTGKLSITAAALDLALTGGSGADTFTMGTSLTKADVIDGGAGTDVLTAEVNGLGTSTTAEALSLANVETVTLNTTGTASYLNMAGAAQVTTLNLSDKEATAGATTTISNLAGGVSIGLGGITADKEYTGTLNLTLADETGTADTVTFVLADTNTDNDVNATLKVGTGTTTVTSGVETVVIKASTDGTANDATLNLTAVAVPKLTISGGNATEVLTLGTVHKTTTTIDASAFAGLLSVTGNTGATTMSLKQGAVGNTIVLGAGNDTLTIADLETDDANGGAGEDILNATIDGDETEATTNFETINLTVKNNVQITLTGANGAGADTAKVFNLLGGDALTTFAHDLVSPTSMTTYNMAGYTGKSTALTVASTAVDLSAVTLTGSAGTDSVSVTTNNSNFAVKAMSGVETLTINAAAGNTSFDVSKTSGLKTIKVDDDNTARTITLTDLTTGTDVEITTGATTTNVVLDLKDKTESANSVKVTVGTTVGTVNIDADEVETFNLVSATAASTVDLAGLSMTTGTSVLNITGNQALTINALHADVATVNASGMTTGGSVIQTARSTTSAVNYTGSLGNDTFIMANVEDVIDAGAGTDTLDVNLTAVLGGIVIDLSKDDVVIQANGQVNSTAQKGFLNVDLAGYTGGYGAVVTAHKDGSTITGTGATDQVTGGAGADTVVVSEGNDIVDTGDGNDTIQFTTALLAANSGTTATFDGAAGTADVLKISDAGTTVVDADFRGISNVEQLTLANGTNTVVTGANAVSAGIRTINAGTGVDTVTIGSGITSYKLAGGADVLTMVGAGYTNQLTIDDSAATTDDAVLVLTGFQDAAADWGTEEANAAAVNAADKWFFDNTSGVLSVWNENKTGGAGVVTITLVGVNDVVDHADNGKLTIDVA